MENAFLLEPSDDRTDAAHPCPYAPATGLFGYSICDGQLRSFRETEGYLRDIEQMPHFAPPSASDFVSRYLASNIGRTRSAS
ncbi:hypothetical protein [Parasphingorhabdus sp.]|uniref:hypothetical protein n=1 Tax=Parasphingorhabdus sp. TaxID=2709688 RepID=UPI00300344D1